MWRLSLHKRQIQGQPVRLHIPVHPSWRSRLWTRLGFPPTPFLYRHYRIRWLPIPLTPLELDVWRPMRPDERERQRNRPVEGVIAPLPEVVTPSDT